ncbi:MAG: hypothetical protein MN733_17585 [Nitrososphaera sp.]|nr:hypothetical protein [Nitrososphaera sp.]
MVQFWWQGNRRLDLYPLLLSDGRDEQQRQSGYAAFVSVRPSELMLIRDALQRGRLTGNERFVDEIDRKLGVRVERRGQGRPAKSENKSVPFFALNLSSTPQRYGK